MPACPGLWYTSGTWKDEVWRRILVWHPGIRYDEIETFQNKPAFRPGEEHFSTFRRENDFGTNNWYILQSINQEFSSHLQITQPSTLTMPKFGFSLWIVLVPLPSGPLFYYTLAIARRALLDLLFCHGVNRCIEDFCVSRSEYRPGECNKHRFMVGQAINDVIECWGPNNPQRVVCSPVSGTHSFDSENFRKLG